MRSLAALGLLVAVSSTVLVGCSAQGSEGLGEVDSVEQLRDAYVAAGGECEWTQTNETTGACGSDSVLVVTASEAEQQGILDRYEVVGDLTPLTAVVGENWIVTAPDAAEVQDALGGELQSFGQ